MSEHQLDWQVVGAAVGGIHPDKAEKPCQDALTWTIPTTGVLIAAVADGAGTATFADIGANIAVNQAVQSVYEWGKIPVWEDEDKWKAQLIHALETVQTSIEAEATLREVEVRQLASTLLLVVATTEGVAVVQVGDGAVVVGDNEDSIFALTKPHKGEYLNETTFITSPKAIETAQIKIWQGKTAKLAMFSDGLQMLALKMPEGTPHQPFFTPLFRFLAEMTDKEEGKEQLEAFLRSPRVTDRTDDDLTLLLASLQLKT